MNRMSLKLRQAGRVEADDVDGKSFRVLKISLRFMNLFITAFFNDLRVDLKQKESFILLLFTHLLVHRIILDELLQERFLVALHQFFPFNRTHACLIKAQYNEVIVGDVLAHAVWKTHLRGECLSFR